MVKKPSYIKVYSLMRMRTLIGFMAVLLVLSGCNVSRKSTFGWPDDHWQEQDFKPYTVSQYHAIPGAYAPKPWAYPQGTSTREILYRWKKAGLITSVTNGKRLKFWTPPSGILTVNVGPQFYNLSPSSQQGFANTVAQLYGVGQQGWQGFVLMDSITGKTIGAYNSQGLLLY
jgi:hypothetical protein